MHTPSYEGFFLAKLSEGGAESSAACADCHPVGLACIWGGGVGGVGGGLRCKRQQPKLGAALTQRRLRRWLRFGGACFWKQGQGHVQAGRPAYSGGLAARQRLLSTATEKSKTK